MSHYFYSEKAPFYVQVHAAKLLFYFSLTPRLS